MKPGYLVVALLIAGTLCGKTFELFSAKSAENIGMFNSMKGASYEFEETERSPWLKISFSDHKYSLVFRSIERSDVAEYFDGKPKKANSVCNITTKENVWTGYDEFKFDYLNPDKKEQTLKVWLFDFGSIASYCSYNEIMTFLLTSEAPVPEPKYLQMGEVAVRLKPGRGTAVVKLTEDILTADKRRVIDISDVRAFAFLGNGKEASFFVNNIRLDGSSENAGIFPEKPPTIICSATKRGYHDAYAALCPFCGTKSHRIDGSNKELKKGNGIIISPEFTAGYGPRGGGGDDQTEKTGQFVIAHYDGSFWENRSIISFKTFGKLSSGDKIIKAELRLYGLNPGKPFIPVMKVYSVSERFKIDLKKTLCWNTKPPVEKLLFVSGVYEGPDTPRWFTYDVSDYFKQKMRSYATFEIRSGISALTYDNPHPKGHCLSYEIKDPSKAPYLYIEVE